MWPAPCGTYRLLLVPHWLCERQSFSKSASERWVLYCRNDIRHMLSLIKLMYSYVYELSHSLPCSHSQRNIHEPPTGKQSWFFWYRYTFVKELTPTFKENKIMNYWWHYVLTPTLNIVSERNMSLTNQGWERGENCVILVELSTRGSRSLVLVTCGIEWSELYSYTSESGWDFPWTIVYSEMIFGRTRADQLHRGSEPNETPGLAAGKAESWDGGDDERWPIERLGIDRRRRSRSASTVCPEGAAVLATVEFGC